MSEMDEFDPDNDRADLPEPSREEMMTLAALADGSLQSGERRAEVEADPAQAALLDEQRRAVALVRNAADEVSAPDALRERLADLAPEVASAPRTTRRPRRTSAPPRASRRPRLLAGFAGAAIVVVLVLTLTLSGTSGSPTLAQAAALATRPAVLAAPRHVSSRSDLVSSSEAGVPFPYWEDHFGWRTVGARTDTLSGRTATTVFYVDRHGRRIAYSIVSGAPLKVPPGATTLTRNGVHLWVVTSGASTIVTWDRDQHSCVLVGTGVPTRTLVRLASWRGNGSIPY